MSLSNTEFLAKLTDLFTPNPHRPHTCFLTQKRFSYQPDGDALMDAPGIKPTFKCLFRATDGHGVKFSTLVGPDEAAVFQKAYCGVLRTGMVGKLKPKKKKVAGKSAAATVVSLPKIVGPKRGPGVERRRRLIRKRSTILLKIRRRRLVKASAATSSSS